MASIIDWPEALRPARVEWGLHIPQEMSTSQYDGSLQSDLLGAPMWFFTMATGVIEAVKVPEWEAFLDQLFGSINRARCWDWRRELPLGPAGGAPVVSVAGTGNTLATSGWTPGVAGILRAGSYLGINGELKRLSKTINSNGAGLATIEFTPPMRAAAPVSTPLILVKPTALFVCTTDRPAMPQEGARHPGWTLSFAEVPA